MTLTYSEWTQAAEAPPPAVFGMRPAAAAHPLQQRTRDRLLSASVSAGGQLLIAGLVLFASWNAIKPEPKAQTITVSISTTERVQPVEPPPQIERVRIETPTMAAPEILIQAPPSNTAPTFVAAPPPPPVQPPAEKVAEAPPVTPPRFDAAHLKNPAPNYPNMSRRLREVGTVQLRVRVSAAGEPLDVLMAKSSGFARLDDSALAAVKKWKFQPAMRGGSAVEDWVIFSLAFGLD